MERRTFMQSAVAAAAGLSGVRGEKATASQRTQPYWQWTLGEWGCSDACSQVFTSRTWLAVVTLSDSEAGAVLDNQYGSNSSMFCGVRRRCIKISELVPVGPIREPYRVAVTLRERQKKGRFFFREQSVVDFHEVLRGNHEIVAVNSVEVDLFACGFNTENYSRL